MQLKRTNLNDKITDTIDDFNDNWGTIEEEVNKKPDGLLVKNEIVNGDFSDGTTGWGVITDAIIEVSQNVLEVKGTVTGGSGALNNVDKVVGDVYFICGEIKGVLNESGIGFSGGEVARVRVDNEFQYLSLNTTTGIRPYIRTVGTNSTFAKNVLTINLTQTFGAGNEPTKEEMDALIEITGYIDDEYILSNLELVNWLLSLIRNNTLSITTLGGTI